MPETYVPQNERHATFVIPYGNEAHVWDSTPVNGAVLPGPYVKTLFQQLADNASVATGVADATATSFAVQHTEAGAHKNMTVSASTAEYVPLQVVGYPGSQEPLVKISTGGGSDVCTISDGSVVLSDACALFAGPTMLTSGAADDYKLTLRANERDSVAQVQLSVRDSSNTEIFSVNTAGRVTGTRYYLNAPEARYYSQNGAEFVAAIDSVAGTGDTQYLAGGILRWIGTGGDFQVYQLFEGHCLTLRDGERINAIRSCAAIDSTNVYGSHGPLLIALSKVSKSTGTLVYLAWQAWAEGGTGNDRVVGEYVTTEYNPDDWHGANGAPLDELVDNQNYYYFFRAFFASGPQAYYTPTDLFFVEVRTSRTYT